MCFFLSTNWVGEVFLRRVIKCFNGRGRTLPKTIIIISMPVLVFGTEFAIGWTNRINSYNDLRVLLLFFWKPGNLNSFKNLFWKYRHMLWNPYISYWRWIRGGLFVWLLYSSVVYIFICLWISCDRSHVIYVHGTKSTRTKRNLFIFLFSRCMKYPQKYKTTYCQYQNTRTWICSRDLYMIFQNSRPSS